MYFDNCSTRPVTLAIMFIPPVILGLTIFLPIGLLLPTAVAPCQWSCTNGTEPCLPQSQCPFDTFHACAGYFHNSSSSEYSDKESYATDSSDSSKEELCTLYLESNQTVALTLPFFGFFSYGFDFEIVFDGFQPVIYSYSNQDWSTRLDWWMTDISVSNYDVAFISTLYVNFTNYPYDHDYPDDQRGDRSGLFISQVIPSSNVTSFLIGIIALTMAWFLICFIGSIVITTIRQRLARGTEMKSLNTVSTWYEPLNED